MENSRIEIKTDGAFSQIFIDGKKLNGVRNYKLEHAAGEAPTLTLDLNAFDLTVDGQMLLMQKGVGEIDVSIKGQLITTPQFQPEMLSGVFEAIGH